MAGQTNIELLDEIETLFISGNTDDALELIDLYLEDHPDDHRAKLLKVGICLEAEKQPNFVGHVLTEMQEQQAGNEDYVSLQTRLDALISAKLRAGRDYLDDGYPSNAFDTFEVAVQLSPRNPSVSLAAALALLPITTETEHRRSRSQPNNRVEVIEKYLRLTLANSTPESLPYREAARHLVKHYVQQQAVDQLLDWLITCPEAVAVLGELATEVAAQVLQKMLGIAATLLRGGNTDDVRKLLQRCSQIAPKSSAIALLQAEVAVQNNEYETALDYYQKALQTADKAGPISLPSILSAWELAQPLLIACHYCGKDNLAIHSTCAYCGQRIGQHDLLTDRYPLDSAPEAVSAHLGLAEQYATIKQLDKAGHHLDEAIGLLPADHKALAPLHELHLKWHSYRETNFVRQVIERFQQDEYTEDDLAQLCQICNGDPPSNLGSVPLSARLKAVRQLLRHQELMTAQLLLQKAFEDNPYRKSVLQLTQRIEAAITVWIEALLEQVEEAFDKELPARAVQLAEEILSLRPQHAEAHFIRGEARRLLGNHLGALDDLRRAIDWIEDSRQVEAAKCVIAELLEDHGDNQGALTALESVNTARAAYLRARLTRRLSNEPAIHIQAVMDVVMHDTLARVPTKPQYQGVFAIAVRGVGRPWNTAQGEWAENILNAGYQFVHVLGGLCNVVGDPVFALRLISEPHAKIAERGQLRLALLARISAEDQTMCENLALDLWTTLRDILPGPQAYAYDFEPVVDDEELAHLLKPFEATSVAEIVRREEVASETGDHYAVHPFTPGSLNLHNLCWALLRQKTPGMVSIHLLPTTLMPWEHTAIEQAMLSEPQSEYERITEHESAQSNDPISRWWNGAPRWGQAQANRFLADHLRSQAYVMAVNVAGDAGANALLPESVASAMFGPLRSASGMVYGGYEVSRAGTDAELDTARRNIYALDVENWVYTDAPQRLSRLRHMVSEIEAALAFRFPIPSSTGVPGLQVVDAKPVAPPPSLPVRGIVLGESIMRVDGAPLRITQSAADRRRHTYIVGKTGVGKSTLLQNLALQDIEEGHGVCVVDPHGELIEEIVERIPENRLEDVIIFDPSDDERPIGLNLLEARSETEKHQIANEFISMLMRMYDPHQTGIVGPRFQHNVRNAMLTVMALEGSTLIEVVRALTDSRYVSHILPQVKDPLVRNYWEKQIANTSDYHKSEVLDYIVSKFNKFVGDQRVRNIVGQRHTTLDFRQVMDEQKILLVNLSKGKIGPENAQFLGLLLVQRLLLTALSRADVPAEKRPDFYLYVDEFQNFATEMFATILSEGRKYGVAVTVANQYLTQLDHRIREALFGNVGSIISFRVGTQDATTLSPEVYPVFNTDDLLNLPKFTACVKLLVDGVAERPFTMRTLPDLRSRDRQRASRISQMSREKYGRDVSEITQDIEGRFSSR